MYALPRIYSRRHRIGNRMHLAATTRSSIARHTVFVRSPKCLETNSRRTDLVVHNEPPPAPIHLTRSENKHDAVAGTASPCENPRFHIAERMISENDR